MRTRSFHIVATWTCLAVCLLIGAAPAEGLVLCLGSDGHVGVGSPASGCEGCSETIPPAGGEPRPEGVGIDAGSPCCPCLDVPVMSGSVVVVQDSPRLPLERSDLPLATLTPLGMPRERAYAPARHGPPPPDAATSTLSRLRSVILRI